jgi:hypothetical protein
MEQLLKSEMLWLKEPGVPEAEKLHLIAFATLGVMVGAKIIAKTLAIETAIAINRVTLIIHVIAHGYL